VAGTELEHPASLYVSHQGARLHRIGERVQVRDPHGTLLRDLPLFGLQRIVLLGNIEVTNAAVSHFFRLGIDVVYLTGEGRFKGRLGALDLHDARVRLAQYRRWLDAPSRLDVARPIVAAKAASGRVLLMRKQRANDVDLAREIQAVALFLARIPRARDIDELMGLEGSCAQHHFAALRRVLKQDLGFQKRVRRPPTDPVNALLSFGYTVLFGQVDSAVRAAGLDPYIGSLHALENGRPSLVLDLMEEVRPIVVDSIVVRVVNEVMLTGRHFERQADGAVHMTRSAMARFLQVLYRRLEDPIVQPATERSVPIRQALELQALHYRRVVLGEDPAYRPVQIR
jgi:CRISPR-associated protein Cas1